MRREDEHAFYESSFKQLADIQQRQVGSLVGASVADAASRAMDHADASELQRILPRLRELGAVEGQDAPHDGVPEIAFIPKNLAPTSIPMSGPLSDHSYPHEVMTGVLGALATNRSALEPELVTMYVTALRTKLLPQLASSFARRATLFESCAAIPVISIYPYAHEDDLLPYIKLVLSRLHDPAMLPLGHEKDGASESYPFRHTFDASAAVAHSVACVISRYMMRNPDPIKNASFRAALGTAQIFACAPGALCAQAATPSFAEAVLNDAAFALDTVRRSRNFAEGVRHCIAHGGNVCMRAIIVGSCLGAKFGVQHIPPAWLRATPGIDVVCQQAIELAQWSWNPLRTPESAAGGS